MKNVAVFFLQRRMGGGTTTYTAHLMRALEIAGANPTLYKIHMKGEAITGIQDFGEYGMKIVEVSADTAVQIAINTPSIIAAPTSPDNLPARTTYRLRKVGAWGVLHDVTQFGLWSERISAPYLSKLDRMICIRESMLAFVPAIFIRHPYERQCEDTAYGEWEDRPLVAMSTARVHNQKRTALILQANQLLRKARQVVIRGAEYRLYSYGLAKRYPNVFKQQGGELQFALRLDCAPNMLQQACFNVDMSKFHADGGGTQYCQLEAMDAGCINIMHQDWFEVPGTLSMGKHVMTVSGPQHLAGILRDNSFSTPTHKLAQMREDCYAMLKRHDPKLIGKKYLQTLGA